MSERFIDYRSALEQAYILANDFLEELDITPVDVSSTYEELKSLWDWNLPMEGQAAEDIIQDLNHAGRPGLVLNQSGRFFAFVIGGSHPSSIAADWLTSAWDQNAGLYVATPSSSIVEEIAGSWLKQLLNIPEQASFAFVTGCQMANFTCLNVARNHLFHQAGWDFEKNGFDGAPPLRIICGDHKHNTVTKALRMLGFGSKMVIDLPTDDNASLQFEAVKKEFERDPDTLTLLILQAGEIHTGAFDDFASIIPLAHQHKAWVHVDGAFGLWANASPKYSHLVLGAELADSWATDGHKWLNVPYDSGYAFTAHPASHFQAMTSHAGYLPEDKTARDEMHWTPELSRRARGYATYAAIRELGVKGIENLIERSCHHAKTIIEGASHFPQTEVMAYPIINQGVLRFLHPHQRFLHPDQPRDESLNDHFTEQVIDAINDSGEAFFQASTFRGKRCMRVSVSNWRTNEEDVRRTLKAIAKAIEKVSS